MEKSGKRPPEILGGHEQGKNSNETNRRKQNVNSFEFMAGKEVTIQLTIKGDSGPETCTRKSLTRVAQTNCING